jgi:integrase
MRGVRPDQYGLRVYVKVHGRQREKRFPAGTDPETIKRWRDETRAQLRKARPLVARGTLEADAEKYLNLPSVQALASAKSKRSELKAWCSIYGTWHRSRITEREVRSIRETWLSQKVAPKTINHRVETFRLLCKALDGATAETPCDHIKRLYVPPTVPKFVSVTVITRVAKRLKHSPVDQARFMVLTSTGQRPAQLKRTKPQHVDLRRRLWMVQPAKQGNPIPVYLNDDMVAAWKRLLPFATDDERGPFWFDTSDYDKKLYAAGWPRDVPPYNAKHTVGITLATSGAEWQDIQDFFGHTDSKTSKVYTGIVPARLKVASAALQKRGLGWAKLR